MKYVCLIYLPEDAPAGTPEVFHQYERLNEDAASQGVLQSGGELAGTGSATSLRVREGKRVITDGPFAETKEILTGFYVFACASLDEALEWAERIPAVAHGTIEIRPLIER